MGTVAKHVDLGVAVVDPGVKKHMEATAAAVKLREEATMVWNRMKDTMKDIKANPEKYRDAEAALERFRDVTASVGAFQQMTSKMERLLQDLKRG